MFSNLLFSSFCWIYLLTIFFVNSFVFADHEIGNGGNVIICKNEYPIMNFKKIYLLDYYEAPLIYKYSIDIQNLGSSVEEKIENIIQRLEKVDPFRAKDYRKRIAIFWKRSDFRNNQSFPNIKDVGLTFLPEYDDCFLKQVAIQKETPFEQEDIYHIKNEVWQKMENDDRAGLLLHEIIYNEFLEHQIPILDSQNVRRFNAFLASTEMENISLESYEKMVHLSGLPSHQHYQIDGLFAGVDYQCLSMKDKVTCFGNALNIVQGEKTISFKNLKSFDSSAHYFCALDDDGVHCQGAEFMVSTLHFANLKNPQKISTGFSSTCVIDDLGIHCQGPNFFEQTNTPTHSIPLEISSGANNCAIFKNGIIECWGFTKYKYTWETPRSLTVGNGHACFLDRYGAMCLGDNDQDQQNIPPLKNPRKISTFNLHTCALDDKGVHCWGGKNTYGELNVPELKNPRDVVTGMFHTCALDDEGLKCWGRNAEGQCTPPSRFLAFPTVR